jgi:hypothetical protein
VDGDLSSLRFVNSHQSTATPNNLGGALLKCFLKWETVTANEIAAAAPNTQTASSGMSPMAACYADGFRMIKERPCKHAAGFLVNNQPPRGKSNRNAVSRNNQIYLNLLRFK